MKRLLALILALSAAAPAAFAQDAAAPYRDWLQSDGQSFVAQAQKRAARVSDPVLNRELKGMASLLAEFKDARDPGSLAAWGDKFFRLSDAALQHRSLAGLADLPRRMKGDYRQLLGDPENAADVQEAQAPAPPPLRTGSSQAALQAVVARLNAQAADKGATLDSLYTGRGALDPAEVQAKARPRAAASVTAAPSRNGSFAYVPAPAPSQEAPPSSGKMGRALAQAFSNAPSPASISEALVVAYFKDRGAARVPAEYRVDGYGQVVGVRLASLDYSETRTFDGGLLRERRIEQGAVTSDIKYDYDTRGRAVRRTVSRSGPQGPLGGAVVDVDPQTTRVVRARIYDEQGAQQRLAPSKARSLAETLLSPAASAAAAVAPLLDWQLDSDKTLAFVSDDRARQYHDPFWYRYLPRVSRGWTDRNDPTTWTVHPVLGVRRPHDGVDMPMAEGTSVYAARRGKVVSVGWEGGYGQRIVIQHYAGNRPDGAPQGETVYGHLSAILVRRGQWVVPGQQIIGRVGSTGISTGPHLHFEIREGDHAVDPLTKLSPTLPNPSGRTVLDSRVAQNQQDND